MATKGNTSNKKSHVPSCNLCCKLLRVLNYRPVIEAANAETRCDDCGTDDLVVAVCINCTLCLCRVCSQYHNNKDHGTVQIPQSEIAVPLTCKEHDGELNHYCETCEKFVCVCCTLTSHADHCCGEMEEMVHKKKNEIKSASSKIDKMMDEFLETHDNIDRVIKRRSDEMEKIDQQYDELFRKLENQKEQAKQQATDTLLQRETALKEQQERLTAVRGEVVNIKELNASLERSTGQEVLSVRVRKQKRAVGDCIEQLATKRQTISNQVGELDKMFSNTTSFIELEECCFDPSHFEVLCPETFYIHGSYKFTVIALIAGHSTAQLPSNAVSIQLKASTGKVVDAKITDNKDGSYTGSLSPVHIGKAKLIVSINGKQIADISCTVFVREYQVNKRTINLKYADKLYVGSHTTERLSNQPWGIAVGKYGLYAMTDCLHHCVCIFDESSQLIKKLGGDCGDEIAQFQNPLGVAFDSNNCLYVADTGNHRVQKFSMSGNFVLQFGHKGMGSGQLNKPHDITVHDGRAYIADSGNKCISVFKTDGQFCSTIGQGEIDIPCGVAVNVDNKLLVACYGHEYLVSFSLDGSDREKICLFSDPQGVYRNTQNLNVAFGVATTLTGDIVVTDTIKHKIRVFDKTGNQVQIINTYRNTNSNSINFPTGICVTSSGEIFATSSSANVLDTIFQLIH
ncbi:E3 ubiquitin-protein ligase TRIM71-like [Dysidea avara]|uniref:E3 ubiquitin-protein ligase TRIM71-like n=1 Tax=Dysidea avara TaxID=196820 RepID=UPI003321797D